MIIGAEILIEGEAVVEIDMNVKGTARGIIIVVAGVAAQVLMITRGVVETGALVVAGVAVTVLLMTGGVEETVCHLPVKVLVAPLAGHHLPMRDLLSGATMTSLHTPVALQHKLDILHLRMDGIELLISEAVRLLDYEHSSLTKLK